MQVSAKPSPYKFSSVAMTKAVTAAIAQNAIIQAMMRKVTYPVVCLKQLLSQIITEGAADWLRSDGWGSQAARRVR